MSLKRYWVDGSHLSDKEINDIDWVMKHMCDSSVDYSKRCAYESFWDEHDDPRAVPELKNCIIREL